MLNRVKKCVISVVLSCVLLFPAGCAGKNGDSSVGQRPAYPAVDYNNSVGSGASVLTPDESGLFSTSLGITGVSYNQSIPEIYAALEDYDSPKSGVKFDANISGAQVYYNKVLNLNDIHGDLITFEVLNNENSEFMSVEVEIIDVYNPSRKVKVSWSYISSPTVTDMVVSCNSVSAAGNNVSVEDFGKLRLQYGATNYMSNLYEQIIEWYGNGHEHRPFHFTYDYGTNEVRADVGSPENQKNFLLLDTDSPLHMGDDPFEGFTTGEVYLRLNFADIVGKGSVVITSIGGRDLSGESFALEPSNAIKVSFSHPSYEKNMPKGEIGVAYPIPETEETDLILGTLPIRKMVLAPDGNTVKIEKGTFTPESAGIYRIVYSGKDINGFHISETYEVQVEKALVPLAIHSNLSEESDIKSRVPSRLPVAEVTGGSGIADISTVYLFNGEEIVTDSVGNYCFEGAGTLEMRVKATDYLGNRTEKNFEYSVKKNPTVRLLSAMPKGVKAGSVFTVPDFKVLDGESDYDSSREIYANGVKLGLDRKITVPESGIVTVDYYAAKGTADELKKSFTVSVIPEGEENDASNLFVANGSVVTQSVGGINIAVSDSDNKTTFAYPISAAMAELYFRDVANSRFDYMEITMADSLEPNVSVSFRVYNNQTLTENFRVQNEAGAFDEYRYSISSSVAVTERKHFFYDNATHSIYNVNLVKIAEIRYCTDGSVFNGFASGVMHVSVRLGGVKGESSLLFMQLGNQPLDENALSFGDIIPPQFAPVLPLASGNVTVGTNFVVPAAYAMDVLSLDATVKVSLTAPDGTILLNRESSDVSRTYRLDKLGNYLLSYSVEDVNGIATTWQYNIISVDNTAPDISVNGVFEKEYTLGEKITLFSMDVTDNIDSAETLHTYVLVINPEHSYVIYQPGDEFTFASEGYYRIQYCARDLSGNYRIVEYEIDVY